MSGASELLRAVGEAVLPGGRVVPPFSAASAEKVLAYVEGEGPGAREGLVLFLRSADALARLRFGRGMVHLDPDRRRRVLRAMERTSFASRLAVKLAVAPMKALHLDDPAIFEALGCPYKPKPVPRERDRAREERSFDGDSLEGVDALECDVVVVGTGAGGAVVAAELARRGREVVLLESGSWLDRADFTRLSRIELSRAAYRRLSDTVAVGNTLIPIPIGHAVGGTTTINSGTCYRTPDAVLERWAGELGLPGLGSREMKGRFDRVDEVLGVGPSDPRFLGGPARVVARGAEALGLRHGPLRRNAPGCDGQGVCCFGCPTDAKRSTNVSYVPMALRAGALLVTGARVETVLVRGGAAYGVVARVRRASGERVPLTVRASRVVLACGSLATPLLLMKNGLGASSGHLGRHLSIHPASGCYARFDEDIDGARSVPQGYAIEEMMDEGILFEGASTPLEMMAIDLRLMGPELVEVVEDVRRVAAFGFMVKDRSRGVVRPGPRGRPLVLYHLGREEVDRVHRGMTTLVRVFLAAGARTVHPPVHGHETIRDEAGLRLLAGARLSARDFEVTAFHPLGTARMSARPRDGVVDPDHELWDVARLHVADGSVLPSSLGVNPQITIMALALRAAERIDALLARDAAEPASRKPAPAERAA